MTHRERDELFQLIMQRAGGDRTASVPLMDALEELGYPDLNSYDIALFARERAYPRALRAALGRIALWALEQCPPHNPEAAKIAQFVRSRPGTRQR